VNALVAAEGHAMNPVVSDVHIPDHWAPDSWQRRVALQQPQYDDAAELAAAGAHLAQLPPVVTSWEVLAL
jgi:3-deoxy-7-phosphoheptulonate synthase